MSRLPILWSALLLAAGAAAAAGAQEKPNLDFAQVEFVVATQSSDTTWRLDVTVRHKDQGWDHYADAWQVVDPETDEVLGERVLLHPHDTEQPFTRSQSAIRIDSTRVVVRAKCDVHGFGGQEVVVDLSQTAETEEYRVAKR